MTILLFAALALIALAGAVGVILSRNPVYSALSLLVNFASIAVMYFMLGAQFLGVVQIIVYAGAIVVLFLFVVMLIGGKIGPLRSESRPFARARRRDPGGRPVARPGPGDDKRPARIHASGGSASAG